MDNSLAALASCLLLLLGVATVRLGLTAFSPAGLCVGLGVRWTGAAGTLLGGVLIALGLTLLVPFAWLVVGAVLRG